MPRLSRQAIGALVLLLAGCQEASGPLAPPSPPAGPPRPPAARLAAVSPTAFTLLPGEEVPTAEVTVASATGEGVPNIQVRFTVLGGGYVKQAEVLTNTLGGAATNWVLGIHPGINLLLASVGELPPVVFIAEGGYESTAESYGLLTTNSLAIPTPGVAGGALLLFGNGTFTQHHVLGPRVDLANSRQVIGSYARDDAAITFSTPGDSWVGTIEGDTVFVPGHEGWDSASYVLMSSASGCSPETASPTGGESTIYTRVAPHRYPAGASSSFELRPDSSFRFQYRGGESSDWGTVGQFRRSDSIITFNFGAADGTWSATGTTRGHTLTIAFNLAMSWDDFEDGVYATALCSAPHVVTNSR